MSIAKVTIVGNLTRDCETRYTPTGSMNVTFTVAVNSRRGQDETVAYYRVTGWGKLAESLDKLTQLGALIKGKQVFVAGELQPREYQANDGTTRMSLDVNADNVELLGSREQSQPQPMDAAMDQVPF